jgi:hypothetical protein
MNNKDKNAFLINEFLTMSIMAALGVRDKDNPVYRKNVDLKEKENLNNFLRNRLIEYSKQYKKRISEKQHICNIEQLAKEITVKNKNILHKKEFRIGIAQKLLNLYLKYLWTANKIPAPPHCPFDDNIISKMNIFNIKWTSLDNIKEYKILVEKAKKCSGKKSLAEWELEIWNQKNK